MAEPIVATDEIPESETLLITLRDGFDEREAILVRGEDGEIRAWENYCQHWPDVRLDRGDGAMAPNGAVVCRNHGAMYAPDDGACLGGPCEGPLKAVEIEVRDGEVHLTDDDYAFVRVGPADDDDPSSTSHVRL